MHKLKKCPKQEGYTFQLGNGVIRQKLDGGASRFENDIIGASHTVAVNWVVGYGDYQYLLAFYRVWERNPAMPFLADLIIDDAPLAEYECSFIDPIQFGGKNGKVFMLSAQLEVKAKIRTAQDDAIDDLIVSVRDQDQDLSKLTNPLEKLANKDLRDALENVEDVT